MLSNRSRNMLAAVVLSITLLIPKLSDAYSVQTHEQLIDLTWKASIVPLLEKRFPNITPAQLLEAHAYAYGGCAIQDIGYYPFGDSFFSDLTHYVRSGDFVDSLLRNARTPDELAFAIGALSHYVGDTIGHAQATNPSVAAEFPKLGAKYGPVVTYEENPHDHVRAEFAFDINEISKGRFAPRRYLNHVGLDVPTDLLARAFFETYGLRLDKTLHVERTTLFGYRFSVRHFLPRIAYAETVLHRNRFPPDSDSPDFQKLKADLAQAGLDNKWAPYLGHAGFGTYTLAGFIAVMPRVGPLSMLAIRGPDADSEERYVKSLNNATAALRVDLLNLRVPPVTAAGPAPLRQARFPNLDLDTGAAVRPGSYRLTDETYAKLLNHIVSNPLDRVPSGLKQDVIAYYANPDAPDTVKRYPAKWSRVQSQVAILSSMATYPQP
jgi:hypothetical protein